MSRSTQFIGLNSRGCSIVQHLERVNDGQNFTHGMFEEEVGLGEWADGNGFIREVVQAEPWSGGPMIFTALVRTKQKAVAERVGVSDDPMDYSAVDRLTSMATDAEVIEESLWTDAEMYE